MAYLKVVIVVIFPILFISCKRSKAENKNIDLLNQYLIINLPDGVSSFYSAEKCLDASFKKPCTFFCVFSIPKENFYHWIKQIKVPNVDSSYKKLYCQNNQYLFDRLTNLRLREFAQPNKFSWWKPLECTDVDEYASVYNSQTKMLVALNHETWDGRVLIRYCKNTLQCYVVIETFL